MADQKHDLLCLESWAGRTEHPVVVLKETPRRVFVRHLDTAFRFRAGQERWVPRTAIRRVEEAP